MSRSRAHRTVQPGPDGRSRGRGTPTGRGRGRVRRSTRCRTGTRHTGRRPAHVTARSAARGLSRPRTPSVEEQQRGEPAHGRDQQGDDRNAARGRRCQAADDERIARGRTPPRTCAAVGTCSRVRRWRRTTTRPIAASCRTTRPSPCAVGEVRAREARRRRRGDDCTEHDQRDDVSPHDVADTARSIDGGAIGGSMTATRSSLLPVCPKEYRPGRGHTVRPCGP